MSDINNIKYKTVQQITEDSRFPFSAGQIRQLLSKRKENGLNNCVRKIGKRLYIRLDFFIEWIENSEEEKI